MPVSVYFNHFGIFFAELHIYSYIITKIYMRIKSQYERRFIYCSERSSCRETKT